MAGARACCVGAPATTEVKETKGRPFVYAPHKKDDRKKSRMKLIKLINDKKQITG